MKIDYLKINSRFKNLDRVEINFDENHLMTVVVGGMARGSRMFWRPWSPSFAT